MPISILAQQRGGPCDRGPGTQGRVLRAMIETNRAELWAVSVAIDGFATFGVLACPVRDFLDDFLVRFEESLVRRLCRYAGVLMVHRGSQDSRKWPFQARSRRAFVGVAKCAAVNVQR